jgi:hypothetical protein
MRVGHEDDEIEARRCHDPDVSIVMRGNALETPTQERSPP